MKILDLTELFEGVIVIFSIIDIRSNREIFLVSLSDVVFEFLLYFNLD